MIKKERLFDRRVVDRYREKGMVKDADYETHIKDLPDESTNAQWVQFDLYETEMSDGDESSGDNHAEADSERDDEEET
jgi:hypothetical protein